MNAFEIAYRLLGQHEASGTYINLSLNSHLTDNISKENKALLTALLYKTVEKKLTYDYYISAIAKRSIDDITPGARDALRLGICAVLDMRSIPDYAAVNEAVKLVSLRSEKGFVNGVLRAVIREKEKLPMPDRKKNAARFLSVFYSLPHKTVKYLISLFGESEAEALLASFNKTADSLTLSVNTTKIGVEDFIKKLNEKGIEATRARFSPISVSVKRTTDPRDLPGFSEGEFFVQDEASALAAEVLSPKPSETVVDVCSAPGGKSFLLSILASDAASVHAFDLHESKISLISSGKERLGLKSLSVSARDALTPDESLFNKVDALLCDVPCSGLGVISKKPDLRYKDIPSVSEELVPLQLSILTASAKYLKSGGRLVYSTCTLAPSENGSVVDKFLSENPDFYTEDFEIGDLKSQNGRITLFPHIHNTDGFFICKLRKK